MNREKAVEALRETGLWDEAVLLSGGPDVGEHARAVTQRSVQDHLDALHKVMILAIGAGLSDMADSTAELRRRLWAAKSALE